MVEFVERTFVSGENPKRNAAILGLFVGAGGVILATYGLLKIKGMSGGIFEGIKVGAGCPICRSFWTGVGTAIIWTVWLTYVLIRNS